MDDHVIWGPQFLTYALPAFYRDPKVALVATNKRVIRNPGHTYKENCINAIQCLYLERHNFEIRSSNVVDGSVFVVSGRTSLVLAHIFCGSEFQTEYLGEYFCGRIGPLGVDDDNFLTRWVFSHGWTVKVQYRDECRIETDLGSPTKFRGGLIRWARTTWRSNLTSLATPSTWTNQLWAVYGTYLAMLTNFALAQDILLACLYHKSGYSGDLFGAGVINTCKAMLPLVLWITAFKAVKPFAFFWRHPDALIVAPVYWMFTYMHSFIKAYAMVTFYDVAWTGRNLAALATKEDGTGRTKNHKKTPKRKRRRGGKRRQRRAK